MAELQGAMEAKAHSGGWHKSWMIVSGRVITAAELQLPEIEAVGAEARPDL